MRLLDWNLSTSILSIVLLTVLGYGYWDRHITHRCMVALWLGLLILRFLDQKQIADLKKKVANLEAKDLHR